tara:strand:- start:411 stop:836 length:426 start_codon:yes stop_codon:yes gene_type:complete
MEYGLTRDQKTYLLLLTKINEPYLCRYIIHLKNEGERIDAYNYHSERWRDIVLSYFQCLKTRYPTYSYVFNGEKFIANIDKNLEFFNKTGISYQVRELVMSLINEYKDDTISEEEKKLWRKEDDILYGKLAQKVKSKMKYL